MVSFSNLDDQQIRTDEDILRVIARAASADFDRETKTIRATYRWSVRDFMGLNEATKSRPMCGFTIARSTVTQLGPTVTDSGIDEQVLSESTPPLASTIHAFCDMTRHLVAVEHNSVVMSSMMWRTTLHSILDDAAHDLRFASTLRIEPIPATEEILTAFRSFQLLTRLKLTLRLPNPELTRFTEKLHREMVAGSIREYTQDMRNPKGLSQGETALPFASAAMAQQGYKNGDVLMEGLRNGSRKTIKTGRHAARGKVNRLRDFIRGMSTNLRTKEAQTAVAAIINEIDTLLPPDDTHAE